MNTIIYRIHDLHCLYKMRTRLQAHGICAVNNVIIVSHLMNNFISFYLHVTLYVCIVGYIVCRTIKAVTIPNNIYYNLCVCVELIRIYQSNLLQCINMKYGHHLGVWRLLPQMHHQIEFNKPSMNLYHTRKQQCIFTKPTDRLWFSANVHHMLSCSMHYLFTFIPYCRL